MAKRKSASLPRPARNWVTTEKIYQRCRLYGHNWDSISLPVTLLREGRRVPVGIQNAQRCTRCTTHRVDGIDSRTGDLSGREYLYPEGYRDSFKGMRAPELRLELVVKPYQAAHATIGPEVIERIRAEYDEGKTLSAIARGLNNDGILNANTRWTTRSVRALAQEGS